MKTNRDEKDGGSIRDNLDSERAKAEFEKLFWGPDGAPRPSAKLRKESPEAESRGSLVFAVANPRHYYEADIVDSVPIFLRGFDYYRLNQKLTKRYEEINATYRQAREAGIKDYKSVSRLARGLLTADKKMLVNRLRAGRDVILPVPVTIDQVYPVGMSKVKGAANVLTLEYGMFPIGDMDDLPPRLTKGHILRFVNAKGEGWFRLGWRRADEERRFRPRKNERPPEGPAK